MGHFLKHVFDSPVRCYSNIAARSNGSPPPTPPHKGEGADCLCGSTKRSLKQEAFCGYRRTSAGGRCAYRRRTRPAR